MPRPARQRPLLVVLLLCTPVLAACGSSSTADVRPPSSSGGGSASSADASASASPSSGADSGDGGDDATTSDLEASGPVKAARAWAAAVAKEVNARSSSHAPTRAVTTARGAKRLPRTYADDYGLRYPGPLPFTPLSVQVSDGVARVPACVQTGGWATGADGMSAQGNQLTASTFVLRRVRGDWRLDRITGRPDSCEGVTVKGYSS